MFNNIRAINTCRRIGFKDDKSILTLCYRIRRTEQEANGNHHGASIKRCLYSLTSFHIPEYELKVHRLDYYLVVRSFTNLINNSLL